MADREAAVRTLIEAIKPERGAEAVLAAATLLAEDANLRSPRGNVAGGPAVLAALTGPDLARYFRGANWTEPHVLGETVTVRAELPAIMPSGGADLALWFGSGGRIARVELKAIPAPPLAPTNLMLTEDIRRAVNGALANGTPILVAYVDPQGQPRMSFRGTAQVFGDEQLAVWTRGSESGFLKGTAHNPKVALFYRDHATRTTYQFFGRARTSTREEDRNRIYDSSPEVERNADPDRKGVATIIDLDAVEGVGPNGRVLMKRA